MSDRTRVQSRDADVYAVLLDSVFAVSRANGHTVIVLGDSTTAYVRDRVAQSIWSDLSTLAGDDNSVVEEFERRSSQPLSLRSIEDTLRAQMTGSLQLFDEPTRQKIDAVRDSIVRSDQDRPGISVDAYWQAFYQFYPGSVGYVSLSAVGFNPAGDKAIVIVTYGCGGLCGEGQAVYLRREQSHWQIMRRKQLWVS